ncbi:MAG: alpha/beta hydrolase [Actinomycetes bacterium]
MTAPLDTSAAAVLELLAAVGLPIEDGTPEQARAMYEATRSGAPPDDLTGLTVTRRDVAGVPCVVTVPEGVGPHPVLVWVHGGGWTIGSADLAQPVALGLARDAGCAVVNVDYRLAPEDPFPAGLDDVTAVCAAVRDGALGADVDPRRVAVGGDSAGGNLSAVVSSLVPGLCHQVLVYPSTDMTLSFPSVQANGEGKLLTAAAMTWFRTHYLVGVDRRDPRVSPLYAEPATVAALPPATVVLAGHDPLHDEGQAYAALLSAADVPVEVHAFPGQIHGFFSLGALVPEAGLAARLVAADLRRAFAGRD